MEFISRHVTQWLTKNNVINKQEEELYEYAVYSLLITMLPLLMAFGIGCTMNKCAASIVFILPFMLIRKYSGGYHCKYPWICIIISTGILYFGIYIVDKINHNKYVDLIFVVSVIGLMILSPIDSANRRLEDDEKKVYKKRTIYLLILSAIVYMAMLQLNKLFAVCVFEGIVLTFSLQIPCVISSVYKKILGLKRVD